MTHNANHVTDHNELRTLVVAELNRFGLPDTLGGPWNPGDPDHLGRHNAMVDALAAVATAASRTYTTPLPPHRALGNTGHIGDHDVMRAAAVEAATWPAWNAATGGTVTDVDNYNGTLERWRVHTFPKGTGTLTVTSAISPFRALVVAGGGAGGGNAGGGGGAGGLMANDSFTIPVGAHTVTVGAGGAISGNQGGNGGASSLGSLLATVGGGGGGRGGNPSSGGLSGGSGGGGSAWSNGVVGGGSGTAGQGFPGGAGESTGEGFANAGGGGASGPGGGMQLGGQTGIWGNTGGGGVASTISGANLYYAGGGAGDNTSYAITPAAGSTPPRTAPRANSGNGSPGGGAYAGADGTVIVAYRIG
jgi:hypothetical protein